MNKGCNLEILKNPVGLCPLHLLQGDRSWYTYRCISDSSFFLSFVCFKYETFKACHQIDQSGQKKQHMHNNNNDQIYSSN